MSTCTRSSTATHALPTPRPCPTRPRRPRSGSSTAQGRSSPPTPITRIVRVITDNGANYRARDFLRTALAVASRHQRTRPYTPRHNGKVERYNRTLAEELLYSRPWTSEAERAAAIEVWNIHYHYHRAHTAIGDPPPASRLPTGVTNVMSQNN